MAGRSLESLPVELVLNILVQLPDLDCLDNLLRASPDVWRLFEGPCVVEAVERALDVAPIDKHTKIVMRTIAYIREGCLPVTSIFELETRITRDSLTHGLCRGGNPDNMFEAGPYDDDEWFMREENIFSPNRFPETCTPATARAILADYRRITTLTLACLDAYLQRFRQLQPRRLVDFTWETKCCRISQIRASHLPTVPIKVHDIGVPTWSEDQAVSRAFWRVQFVDDLKSALASGSLAGWTTFERDKIQGMSVMELYNFPAVLDDIDAASYTKPHGVYDAEITEQSLILIAMDFLDGKQQYTVPRYCLRPQPALQSLPKDQYLQLERHWSQGVERFGRTFESTYFVKKEVFAVYRDLGFPIWSTERLEGYGFTCVGPCTLEKGPNFLTWTSILQEDVVEKAVKWEIKTYGEWKGDESSDEETSVPPPSIRDTLARFLPPPSPAPPRAYRTILPAPARTANHRSR